MIKKLGFFLVMLMISAVAFSNVKISAKHKDLTKDGKKINCTFCHTDNKIEKKKGQYKDDKLNGKALSKIKSCAGAKCHK